MPTSITVGARLDPVAPHHLGPCRPPRTPGRRGGTPPARSRVLNARPSPSRSRRAGAAPAACRRCWSGRSPPLRGRRATGTDLARTMQPSGVQGASAGSPADSRPAFTGWKPSTSFAGSIAAITFCASICGGSGSCTRMPCTAGSALRRPTSASSSASLVVAGRPVIERAHAAADGQLHPCCRRRPRSPGCCRPARPRGPGVMPRSRASRCTVRDLAAQVRRDRLAVDDLCGHARPLMPVSSTALPDRADFLQRRGERRTPPADLQTFSAAAPRPRHQADVARRDAERLAISRISAALASPSLGARARAPSGRCGPVRQSLDAVDRAARPWA